jgi:DNA adenine methylase
MLVTGDFEETLASAGRHDFVYIDPPYVYSDRKDRGEYGANSFACSDLARLHKTLSMLDRKKALFLLSYLECDDIKPHLNGWNVRRVPVRRQIASFVSKRTVVNELLVSNYD